MRDLVDIFVHLCGFLLSHWLLLVQHSERQKSELLLAKPTSSPTTPVALGPSARPVLIQGEEGVVFAERGATRLIQSLIHAVSEICSVMLPSAPENSDRRTSLVTPETSCM